MFNVGEGKHLGRLLISSRTDNQIEIQFGFGTFTPPVEGAVGPAWFEADEHLARCIALAPRHAVFITTRNGAAKSQKSAASWFSRACNEAGLPDLSAHGIRKYRASVFKENGAAADQRMAVLGHETESEAKRYSRAADLKKTILGTEVPTQSEPSSNFGRLSNKNNV